MKHDWVGWVWIQPRIRRGDSVEEGEVEGLEGLEEGLEVEVEVELEALALSM